MHAGRPASVIPIDSQAEFWCAQTFRLVVVWWWLILFHGGDVWCHVVGFEVTSGLAMWLVTRCHVMWCYVMWCDVVSCHFASCRVMWCDAMGWNDMWDVHSNARCDLGMQDTRRLRRAHVTQLRLGTTKYYSGSGATPYYAVLQSTTPVLLHSTKYYKVLVRTTIL